MNEVKINLRNKSYPVLIGKNCINLLPRYIPEKATSIFLIADEKLDFQIKKVISILKKTDRKVIEVKVKAGERLKSLQGISPLYDKLLSEKADRNSIIIALGGGSIGDAIGLVASTYMRGIDWIGIPTTLLAQVDSSVGGKTGINHKQAKNVIGTFHQPKLVICDSHMLKGLGKKEIVSGVGEIIKYSITFDKIFFDYLDKNIHSLLKLKPQVLTHAIEKSIEWKSKMVSKDEYDRKGIREVLNFGHTFGHALETVTNYKVYQHGEAVIWGMIYATTLSEQRGKIQRSTRHKIESLLKKIPVTPLPKKLDIQETIQIMKKDKKASSGKIRFVLIKKIGKSVSDKEVTDLDMENAFKIMRENL